MALSSLALYVKKYPDEVKEIMRKVSESDSPLKENSAVLYEKVQGKGYRADDVINKKISDPKERETYKNARASYVEGLEYLNTRQKNKMDKGLLPFMPAINKLIDICGKFKITNNDTITVIEKDLIALRSSDGRFYDSICGINVDQISILDKRRLKEKNNLVAHEFNHALLANILDDNDENKLIELYGNAKEENRFLDSYSATNYKEYFAVGYDNYLTNYLPHSKMIDNGNYYRAINTNLSLKHKDPDLYKFIEHCIEKHGLSQK
ncbi:MAG: hypothetical protein A2104_04910 [Candidatus Melainabacteria bacterium GWF2_32_7]|nr:MAG: hypothetical protein A2104_04910 [Candidatus Melainabacteria bacterium GWF2_32_7]